MTLHRDVMRRICALRADRGWMLLLTGTCAHIGHAQAADAKVADSKQNTDVYQTLYLTGTTGARDINDLMTDMRSMMPKSRFVAVDSQNAISVKGPAEDIALAQKIVADLDRPRKIYRLVYKITETGQARRRLLNNSPSS